MISSQTAPAPVKPSGSVLWITPWEKNALQLLADGCTTNELSSRLGFRPAEIESLLARLFAEMGAATQTQAVLIAQERGLLTTAPAAECAPPFAVTEKAS